MAVEATAAQDAALLQEVCTAAGDVCLPYQLALALALNDTAALSGKQASDTTFFSCAFS